MKEAISVNILKNVILNTMDYVTFTFTIHLLGLFPVFLLHPAVYEPSLTPYCVIMK